MSRDRTTKAVGKIYFKLLRFVPPNWSTENASQSRLKTQSEWNLLLDTDNQVRNDDVELIQAQKNFPLLK